MKIPKSLFALLFSLIAIFSLTITGNALCFNGDVDNNNFISTADAKLALCYSANIVTPTESEKNTADVNRDGYITTREATIILEIAAGIQKPITHEYSDWEIVEDSTCTQEGYLCCYCTICDKPFTKKLLPKGHKFIGQSCTENGCCENCGEIIPATGHNMVNGTCSNCDFTISTPTITYKNKSIDFNSSSEKVISVLGKARDVLTDTTNKGDVKILVYYKNYRDLGIFTFFNNQLTQFYTNNDSSIIEHQKQKYSLNEANNSQDLLIGDIAVHTYTDTINGSVYSYLATIGEHYTYNITSDFTTNEKLIIHLVNGCRALHQKAPLLYSEKAHTSAYKHSLDMATNHYFSHEGLDGSSPGDRMYAEGINWYMYAENIAAGYRDAYAQNDGWYNSPGHRSNMLEKGLKYLGVGIAYNEFSIYKYYATQNFFSD